jgi:hypothetical protein
MPLKVSGGLAVIIGIVFLAMTMINNLFEVGPAFEELIDDFRPVLTDESLDTARADIAVLEAAGIEFQTVVGPAMAQAFGMTPEQFGGMVESQYPAVAQGMEALPAITETFTGLIDTLDSQGDLFASADAIPSDDLPANTVPWIIAISGVLALGLGVMMFKPGPIWAILVLALGVILVISTVVLSLPQKAADADQLNENLTPIYTQDLIDRANASLVVIGAMGEQMQTAMLPDLAAQLGMTLDELNVFMGEQFPATAAAMQSMPESLPRFNAFVGIFDANLDNFETIQPVAFSPIIWAFLLGGVLIAISSGYCVLTKQYEK